MPIMILAEGAALHPATAGETHAATEAGGHHESAFSPTNPEFWVYAGLTIFILLAIFVAKAPQKIAAALDGRIADTRRNLDEAAKLRAEAEALLADAKARHAASAGDAAAVIAQAKDEAARMLAGAEAEAATLVERRARMAEDRIAASERAALADLRATAARAAADAARTLIVSGHGADADRTLVDRAIKGLN